MPSRIRRARGHIETLPSGSFRAVVYSGADPLTNKPRYLRETHKTHAAAQVALTRMQSQVDEERHPPTDITVSQAVAQWLEVVDLADTTRERYDDLIRLYITPVLGDRPAAKLDARVLDRLYARLQQCGELCDGRRASGHVCRPLSSSTVRKVHYIIRGALERAVRWQQLGVNRAELVDPPAPAPTEPDPPSPEEAALLLNDAWADPEWGLLLWLTMLSGARRGEVCALRWVDVDATRALLWVPASISQTRAGLTRKATKSEKGRRVSLDPYTLGLLAEHRTRREELCAALGASLSPDSYLFSPDRTAGREDQPAATRHCGRRPRRRRSTPRHRRPEHRPAPQRSRIRDALRNRTTTRLLRQDHPPPAQPRRRPARQLRALADPQMAAEPGRPCGQRQGMTWIAGHYARMLGLSRTHSQVPSGWRRATSAVTTDRSDVSESGVNGCSPSRAAWRCRPPGGVMVAVTCCRRP